ncbi:mobilization protein [Salmonella enterica]|nr:mobilization protein [Salmonella enterica]EAZ8463140.1 mobilization protein [Salmonella enterica]EBC7124796.1 mobilization protein [Salmonella enterica]ECK2998425.1 mobilization protein [Salmonella enterica]EEB2944118.1 mobilization protein [Salmonella enterica]
MSVSLTLQERLKQQHLAESETIQSLTKQQLSSLRSELNGIFQQELNTMLEDMRRQLHDTTEDMRQSRQSMLLTVVKNRVIFPALSAVTILAVIFLSGWGLSTFQESQIMANWQQINSQKATLATLESKTAGLNIVQDKNGTFVVLPKGAKLDDSGWTVGKQQALRIVR